jgi:histidyl-tRNA synthetase
VFLAVLAAGAQDRALLAQRALREAGARVLTDHDLRGLKSQMKKADKLGARYVAIMGEDELKDDVWTVRDMQTSTQERVSDLKVAEYLEEKLRG